MCKCNVMTGWQAGFEQSQQASASNLRDDSATFWPCHAGRRTRFAVRRMLANVITTLASRVLDPQLSGAFVPNSVQVERQPTPPKLASALRP
jgi:hypothetical protein